MKQCSEPFLIYRSVGFLMSGRKVSDERYLSVLHCALQMQITNLIGIRMSELLYYVVLDTFA